MKYFFTAFITLHTCLAQAQSARIVYPVGDLATTSAELSADSRYLLNIKNYNTANVWDPASGKLLYSIPMNWYTDAKFSPDGRSIITLNKGNINETVLKTGKQQTLFNIGEKPGTIRRLSRDGRIIAIHKDYAGGTIQLWSYPEGKLIMSIRGKAEHIRFTKDNRYVSTLIGDSCITWDLQSRQIKNSFSLSEYGTNMISPDGKFVLASKDNVIYILKTGTGDLVKELKDGTGKIRGFDVNPESNRLISVAEDGFAKLWDIESGHLNFQFSILPDSYRIPNLSPDGNMIAARSRDNLTLYNSRDGKNWDSTFLGKEYSGLYFSFSPDSKNLLVMTGQQALLYSIDKKEKGRLQETQAYTIEEIMLSPGTKYLLCTSGDTAILCDPLTGKILVKMTMGRSGFDCAFNSNSTRMLMWDGADITLWSIPDGRQLLKKFYAPGKVYHSVINDENTRIASVSSSYTAIWETDSAKRLQVIENPVSLRRASPIFNKDGKNLITANGDSILFYLSDSGKKFKRFDRVSPDSSYEFVYLSPDEHYLMTHDKYHQYATVWEIGNGKRLYSISGLNPRFSKDGNYIIAGETVYTTTTGKQKDKGAAVAVKLPSSIPPAEYDAKIDNSDGRERKMAKVTNFKTGGFYYLMLLSGNNFLVFDDDGHFDGTAAARSLLYLACGDRIVDDPQVIGQLWVPGLAEKKLKAEPVTNKKVKEIPVCAKD